MFSNTQCKLKICISILVYLIDIYILYYQSNIPYNLVLGHFGHGHFGLGRFGPDISATDVSATENADVSARTINCGWEMSMSEEAKQNAWAEHYERLLNVEFDWDPDHLSNEPPLECPPIPITIDMVKKAISKMKSGKAAGPSGIVVEMIKAAGDTGATMIRDLATAIIRDGKVPTD